MAEQKAPVRGERDTGASHDADAPGDADETDKDGGPGEAGDPVSADDPDDPDDVQAVTRAVLAASRVLVAVSARSLAAVEDRVTLPQFRMLVVLATRDTTKLVDLAGLLQVAPSTAMRMVDRLIAAGLADRQAHPENRRENLLTLTAEGRRTVEEVTVRRHREIAAIVRRVAPARRAALVEALSAFSEAGGEALESPGDAARLFPLGWAELPAPQDG